MSAIYVAVRLIELTTSHLYELIGSTNVCHLLTICRVPAFGNALLVAK